MNGYEEQLHARAELLDDTGDLVMTVGEILDGAAGAGLDPGAIGGLRTAVQALDPAGAAPAYDAGKRTDRAPGTGFGSDAEFIEAVHDAVEEVRERPREAGQLQERCVAAMDKAHDDLDRARLDLVAARTDLAAAHTMPVGTPCDGCHRRKATAVEEAENRVRDAEERVRDATRRLDLLGDTMELLELLARRLQAALQALRQVPADLGEVYELVFEFVSRGGKLPHFGRWIEGAGA